MKRWNYFFIIGFFVLLTSAGTLLDSFEGFRKSANFPEPVYDLSKNPVTKK